MNKTIFLDRDGTIIEDYGYVYEISKLKFTNFAIEGLKKMCDAGYQLIIITNQSGIGRGYYTSEDFNNFNNYMIELLKKSGINIRKVYYCPHIDNDNCECRKPKTKLFYDAIKEFNVDVNNSYTIGDKDRDLSITLETNIKGIMVFNDSSNYISKKNLLEAANYIINEE